MFRGTERFRSGKDDMTVNQVWAELKPFRVSAGRWVLWAAFSFPVLVVCGKCKFTVNGKPATYEQVVQLAKCEHAARALNRERESLRRMGLTAHDLAGSCDIW